jgi:hypothetical protein
MVMWISTKTYSTFIEYICMPLIQQFLNTKKLNYSGFWQIGKTRGTAIWEYFGTIDAFKNRNIPIEHWMNRCDGVHYFEDIAVELKQIHPCITVFNCMEEENYEAIIFLAWEQRKFENYKMTCQMSLRSFTNAMTNLIIQYSNTIPSSFITCVTNHLDTLRIQQNYYTPRYVNIQSSHVHVESFGEIQHVFPLWSEQTLSKMFSVKPNALNAFITGNDELCIEYDIIPRESVLSKLDIIPEITYKIVDATFQIFIQIVSPPYSTNTLYVTSGKTVRLDVQSNEIYMICSKLLKKLHITESMQEFADVVVIDAIPHVMRHNIKYIVIGDLDLKSYTPVAKITWPVSSDDFKDTLCFSLKKEIENDNNNSVQSKLVFSENSEILHGLKQIGASVVEKEFAKYYIGNDENLMETIPYSLNINTMDYPFKLQQIIDFLNQ